MGEEGLKLHYDADLFFLSTNFASPLQYGQLHFQINKLETIIVDWTSPEKMIGKRWLKLYCVIHTVARLIRQRPYELLCEIMTVVQIGLCMFVKIHMIGHIHMQEDGMFWIKGVCVI